MRVRPRELLLPGLSALGGALFLAWFGFRTMAFTDYEREVEPALQALVQGDLGGFAEALPSYGGSLVLRAPFALLPELWDGGDFALFRSVAAPCLAAGVALGLVLYSRGVVMGRDRAACWGALTLCAVNPLTLRALEIGHPEELLGGALCVGAALAAGARHPLTAGALLGLAIANKPWAVLAVAPVALIAPCGRLLLIAATGVAAAAVMGPLWLVGSSAVANAGHAARDAGEIFQPWQLWWFLGDHGQVVMGTYGPKVGYRAAPDWVGQVARPLVVLAPIALSLLAAWSASRRKRWPGRGQASGRWRMARRGPRPVSLRGSAPSPLLREGLLLLALVLLLRCLLDPWNVVYYELPFLLALSAWELHARDGLPVISLTVTLLCWVTLEQLTRQAAPDVQAAAFLAWSVPLAGALALRLLAPARWRTLAGRLSLGQSPFLAQLLQVGLEGQRGRRA